MAHEFPRGFAGVEQLHEFDAIIDARSPSEFIDDHLPRAISLPVLSDAERAEVGTLYKQVSPFDAKKLGAAHVARNIARHIETSLRDQPKDWRPLVYCWRGGQRSGAFAHILREIGWDAQRLHGGYKSWRRHVIDALDTLPATLNFKVITGATGSGKSRLLEALAARGAQVLHLEQLAAHKGSVLGSLPSQEQPSQRHFESLLFDAIRKFTPERPVFVEAESRRIGQVHVPGPLIETMRQAPCLRIETGLEARVEFLLRDYDYAIANPPWLDDRIDNLKELQSRETLDHWHTLIRDGDFPTLVNELLIKHYDPLYQRSQSSNFTSMTQAQPLALDNLSDETLKQAAQQLTNSHSVRLHP
jgi:tRNA 2-selenouridine synthase